jgi:hypothetical protein
MQLTLSAQVCNATALDRKVIRWTAAERSFFALMIWALKDSEAQERKAPTINLRLKYSLASHSFLLSSITSHTCARHVPKARDNAIELTRFAVLCRRHRWRMASYVCSNHELNACRIIAFRSKSRIFSAGRTFRCASNIISKSKSPFSQTGQALSPGTSRQLIVGTSDHC